MLKVRSASILFKKEVSYDLPEKTKSLEIGDSLCDYEFIKGRENERSKKSCGNMQSNTHFSGYKSENSDSLVSSESSSDPDISPPEKQPIFGEVWNKFRVAQNDKERLETKKENTFENIFLDCLPASETENTKNYSSLPFNFKQMRVNSSENKFSDIKNSVLPIGSSNYGVELDDDSRFLDIQNNWRDNGYTFSSSADIKGTENKNNCLDSVLNWNSHSSSLDSGVCLSDMLISFESYGVGKDFQNVKSTQHPNIDDQCNLPGVVKNSAEINSFSGLLDDICLQDKNEKFFSSYLSSSTDVDSFLNCLNLNESYESSVFNFEMKLKNLDDAVICDDNISLAALAEHHLQSNTSSNNQNNALRGDDYFSSLIKEPKRDNNNSAEHHLQSNTSSNNQNNAVRVDDYFSSLIKEPERDNNNSFSPHQYKTLHSSIKTENDNKNMFDFFADLIQENSIEENKNFKFANQQSTLKVVKDNDENEDCVDSLDIDLTSCLKSLRPVTPLNDSCLVKKDNESFVSDMCVESPIRLSPLPIQFSYDSLSEVKNSNFNESLFGKALSSKPRKNLQAMLQVLELQSEICQHFFSQPLLSNSPPPVKEKYVESNQSVIGLIGRRSFGQITYCEVL